MSSAPAVRYDEALLAQAPELTRAQRQEGYDHVLLEPNRRATRTEPDFALKESPTEPEVQVAANAAETQNAAHPLASQWWRRWKLIVGAVITLVVLAAIVGGAVGGTVDKGKSKSISDTVTSGGTAEIGTLSATSIGTPSASDQSGVSGVPSVTSTSKGPTLSLDGVAVGTQPAFSSDMFVPVRTGRHFSTA
ncbi:hypothetical protein B0H12DRAFT_1233187 [Mycena haematopus]|nr:hypothetical protein B0H12DRAFT_1233187 [Mycena haematopus]